MARFNSYRLIPIVLIILSIRCYSQPLSINWQQCYGGGDSDFGVSLQKVNNGYLLFGTTNSNDWEVTGNHGGADFWLIRVDSTGNLIWQKTYGGTGDEVASKMIKCFDGGYLLCGTTDSQTLNGAFNGDVFGNHGSLDYWLIKVDSLGTIEWSKCYGGSVIDGAHDISSTSDSGFLVCGRSFSIDGDVTGNHGGYDAWVIRVDKNGNLKWEKSYGGSMPDWANSILQTTDGGFIFCGMVQSNDGDVQCDLHGRSDVWIVKGDSAGNIEWQKCYGGTDYEGASAIIATPDSGYLFAGSTYSNDGDVTGYHGDGDIWVFKINLEGDLLWQKCFGGSLSDGVNFLKLSDDKSYLVGGVTSSHDGDVTGNNSIPEDYYGDMWLLKISSAGDLIWQNCLGGLYDDDLEDLIELPNGQMMLLGGANNSVNSGDVNCGPHGSGIWDFWLLSVTDTTEVGIEPKEHTGGSIIAFPNPASDVVVFQYSLKGNYAYPNIRIFDELGNVIETIQLTESSGKSEWNIGNIKAGLYFYQVNTDLVSLTGKIMIIK